MTAGQHAIADDGILVHPDQPAGLAHAAPFGDVGQDGNRLVLRQPGVEQWRALAFGEAGLASTTVKNPPSLGPIAVTNRQIARVTLSMIRTLGVLTAKV